LCPSTNTSIDGGRLPIIGVIDNADESDDDDGVVVFFVIAVVVVVVAANG
jgi:hypothetical protein